MKVLFCTASIRKTTTGSAGVARMISGMQDENIRVDVVEEDETIYRNAWWHRFPPIAYALRSRNLWKQIKGKWSKETYDVLFFNDIWFAYRAITYLRSKNRREAVVAFMHDDSTLDMSDLRTLSGRWLNFNTRAWIERKVIPHLDAILTNSDYLRDKFSAAFPGKRVFRLYYTAMDYRDVQYRPKGIDPHQPVKVLFIKKDFIRGGLDALISALGALTAYQFILTIIGPTESELRRKLGTQLDGTSRLKIICMGEVTDQESIKAFYHEHDIVCISSRQEALGLVNAEAMASGVPVIATPVGGIPEVLDDGRGGLLTDGCDAGAIAKAIKHCLAHPEETYQRVSHGRMFVLDRFALQTMCANLKHILQDVVSIRKPGLP